MKIFEALLRRSKQADAEAAKAIDVTDEEANRQNLEAAKKEISNFESSIVKLIGSRKLKEKRVVPLEGEVAKYDSIAKKAGAAQDADGVRQAVTKLQTARTELTALQQEIKKDIESETVFRKRLDSARDVVARSEQKTNILRVREESSNIRKALAQGQSGSGSSAIAKLSEWESKVDQKEAEAEAQEDISFGAADQAQALEDKYGGGNEALDAEMAKYLTSSVTVEKVVAGQLPSQTAVKV